MAHWPAHVQPNASPAHAPDSAAHDVQARRSTHFATEQHPNKPAQFTPHGRAHDYSQAQLAPDGTAVTQTKRPAVQ